MTVDNVLVKAISTDEVPECIREIKSLLRERHHIKTPSEDDDSHDDFNIRDMTEITRTITQTSTMMGILLMIVAAISLVVGGVGIMNIMLVSVTERTREIGLRMAVGAQPPHPPPVPRGGGGPLPGRRRDRCDVRAGGLDHRPQRPALADQALAADHHRRGGRFGVCRHRLRFLSRLEGLAA